MSVLFPKLNKPKQWDYRPIYFDPEKEARNERRARLHRGSFREEHEKNKSQLQKQHSSKLMLWLVLLAALIIGFYFIL